MDFQLSFEKKDFVYRSLEQLIVWLNHWSDARARSETDLEMCTWQFSRWYAQGITVLEIDFNLSHAIITILCKHFFCVRCLFIFWRDQFSAFYDNHFRNSDHFKTLQLDLTSSLKLFVKIVTDCVTEGILIQNLFFCLFVIENSRNTY